MNAAKRKRYKKLQGKHILVVEDYVMMGNLLVDLLRHYDHASLARSGREALWELKREPPDVILLDMLLPDMTGLEVVRAVRQNKKTKSIPILAMSGLLGEKNKCLKAGCDGFITKPFETEQLLNELDALLPS